MCGHLRVICGQISLDCGHFQIFVAIQTGSVAIWLKSVAIRLILNEIQSPLYWNVNFSIWLKFTPMEVRFLQMEVRLLYNEVRLFNFTCDFDHLRCYFHTSRCDPHIFPAHVVLRIRNCRYFIAYVVWQLLYHTRDLTHTVFFKPGSPNKSILHTKNHRKN